MMTGKRVLITGATNGIGEATALELARMGAEIVIISRNQGKCETTIGRIKAQTGNSNVTYIVADLSTMSEVRRAANEFSSQYDSLDVLINNAGAMFSKREVSVDGYEMTLALNHLNYFLLTNLLLPKLQAAANASGEARIINVSSDAHRVGPLHFDDLQREKKYTAFAAYSESKLMNVMFTYELARRLEGTGITANAVHPGFVRTGFGQNNNILWSAVMSIMQIFAISPQKGASTSIYLASAPEMKDVTGKYFANKKATRSSSHSYDESDWSRLWEISEVLTGFHSVPAE